MSYSFQTPQTDQGSFTLQNPAMWFAQPGANPFQQALKANGLNKGNFEQQTRRGVTAAMLPAAMQGIQFGTDYAPMRSSMAADAIRLLNPANNQAKVDRFRKRATAQAGEDARRIGTVMSDQGFGSGAEAAMLLSMINRGNQSTNNFASQIESPEYLLQNQQAIQSIIDSASVSPYLQMILSGTQREQQQQPSSGGGLLGTLAGLAGMASGLGWSPLG